MRKQNENVIILNLACTDIVTVVVNIPWDIAQTLEPEGRFPFGQVSLFICLILTHHFLKIRNMKPFTLNTKKNLDAYGCL